MKRKKHLLLLAIPLMALSSCLHLNGIEGNHHVTSENRHVAAFSEISSSDDLDVYIVPDSVSSVRVEAESNLIPYIETQTDNSKLKIKIHHNRNLRNHSPIKVFVYTPSVDDVSLSGSGTITADSLNAYRLSLSISGSGEISVYSWTNYLDAKISGSGKIFLSGISDETDFDISGSGSIDAYNLEQDTCFADISGSGDMYLRVLKYLDVRISGSGNVHYIGNPVVNTHISGSGDVIQH